MEHKEGFKTTEFWNTQIMNVLGSAMAIAVYRGLIAAEEADLWMTLIGSLAMAIIAGALAYNNAKYMENRTKIKTSPTVHIEGVHLDTSLTRD